MTASVPSIHTENLSKHFGRGKKRIEAVKSVDLTVEPGQVYGFLGPNGAGKTTTIRMLLRLLHPTTGRAYIYGQDVARHPEVLRRVGAIVEGATFYNFLTARRNLEASHAPPISMTRRGSTRCWRRSGWRSASTSVSGLLDRDEAALRWRRRCSATRTC